MPVDRKIQVEIGGAKHDVEIPEGWMHSDDIAATHTPKDQFSAELDRRVKSITKDLRNPEDLVKDQDFLVRVAKESKDPLIKLLGITPSKGDIDIDKIQEEAANRVRQTELKPIKEQLDGATTEVGLLRTRNLRSQVRVAYRDLGGTKDLSDLVELFVAERVVWDPERREWFAKKFDGSDGYEYSADPKKGGHPYMGVSELLESIKVKGERPGWFQAETQPGADYKGGPAGGGSVTLDSFKKLPPQEQTAFYQKDPQKYMEFMDKIRQEGEQKLFSGHP